MKKSVTIYLVEIILFILVLSFVPVNVVANPPYANAGNDLNVNQGTTVTFDGSASCDDVGVTEYIWTFDVGGVQTLYGISPTYTFNNAGQFLVTLKVGDATGNQDTDTMSVTVKGTNTNPVADAGSDQIVNQGALVTFDGSGSWDDSVILDYTWTFIDGEIKTLYGECPTYTFSNTGEYSVTLKVTDPSGDYDTDTMTVVVNDINPDDRIDGNGSDSMYESSSRSRGSPGFEVPMVIISFISCLIIVAIMKKHRKLER